MLAEARNKKGETITFSSEFVFIEFTQSDSESSSRGKKAPGSREFNIRDVKRRMKLLMDASHMRLVESSLFHRVERRISHLVEQNRLVVAVINISSSAP
jgi:hypothetical protein